MCSKLSRSTPLWKESQGSPRLPPKSEMCSLRGYKNNTKNQNNNTNSKHKNRNNNHNNSKRNNNNNSNNQNSNNNKKNSNSNHREQEGDQGEEEEGEHAMEGAVVVEGVRLSREEEGTTWDRVWHQAL